MRQIITWHNQRTSHLQCSSNATDEEPPTVLLGVVQSGSLHFRAHGIDDVLHVVVWKEIRDLSGRQQVVDQHQEAFVSDLETNGTKYVKFNIVQLLWNSC